MPWLDNWRQWIKNLTCGNHALNQRYRATQTVSTVGAVTYSSAALPRNLRRLRLARGLTVTQLAAMAQVSTSTVRDMERINFPPSYPSPNPTPAALLALAKALEVGLDALVLEETR